MGVCGSDIIEEGIMGDGVWEVGGGRETRKRDTSKIETHFVNLIEHPTLAKKLISHIYEKLMADFQHSTVHINWSSTQ